MPMCMKSLADKFSGATWTSLLVAVALTACGQDPSFLERERGDSHGSDSTRGGAIEDGGVAKGGEDGGADGTDAFGEDGGGSGAGNEPLDDVLLPGGGSGGWIPDWVDGDTDEDGMGGGGADGMDGGGGSGGMDGGDGMDGDDGSSDPIDIPGADDDDLGALHKCLAKWRNHPFKGTVHNYNRISASVSVGGMGNVINDTENTSGPWLTLVDAGVNVGGTPTYNLLNRNGYYCIKVNVNVMTSLTVNLHCNARLADSKVNVNVGSTQNDSTSAVGVHVMSNIKVNTVRPSGDTCIR